AVVLDQGLALAGAVAEDAGDGAELVVGGGDHVAGGAADQHHRVPDAGGQLPGLGQGGGVGGADQSSFAGGGQRQESPVGPKAGHGEGVPQLEKLDGPLDVRQPARTELDVQGALDPARYALAFDPGLETADLAHAGLGDAAV